MKDLSTYSDDELLSAYLDNELPDDVADEVTERLAAEPAFMQRLEAMQANDAATRDAFKAVDEQPMPQAVLDMIDAAAETSKPNNVVQFPQRGVRSFLQMPVAIAASVALVAGYLATNFLQQADIAAPAGSLYVGTVEQGSEVFDLLESGTSAAPQQFADGSSGYLALTFEDVDGDYCRQLRVESDSSATHGVACRREGQWQMQVLSQGPGTAEGPFQQASGTTPAAINSTIDALIGSSDPLDSEKEKQVISNTWKKIEK